MPVAGDRHAHESDMDIDVWCFDRGIGHSSKTEWNEAVLGVGLHWPSHSLTIIATIIQ